MAALSLEEQFQQFSDVLEEEANRREAVKAVVQKIESVNRSVEFSLQKVQGCVGDEKAIEKICADSSAKFAVLAEHWKTIEATLGGPTELSALSRAQDQWRNTTQNMVGNAAFLHFLRERTLISKDECEQLLCMGSVGLKVEDFLVGMTSLPRELSRLCVNCVAAGDYALPHVIAKFVNEMYSAYRLLNLKNDTLRRRFDGIKYSVQKIEDVMYDLSVRQLSQKQK